MTYRGHIKNGQVAFNEPVDLPEGAEVTVEVAERGPAGVWEQLLSLAGTVEGLPPDMARNHDHYLYGVPKKK